MKQSMLPLFHANNKIVQAFLHLPSLAVIVGVFLQKNLASMLQQNSLWRSGAWYEFLSNPSSISNAGLLDSTLMAPYYKTLSISLGHQLIARIDQLFGFEMGTLILYVAIVSVFAAAVYLISLHWTKSKIKAFLIGFCLVNSDVLAMGHIGGCGSLAQGPARDYLALGFILLSFYFLLANRIYIYWIFLYAGFLLHLSHGLFSFFILLPATFLIAKNLRFIALHVFSFVGTAFILYLIQSADAVPLTAEIQKLWFKSVYIFNGGHIFFDHSINYLVPNFAFLAILVAGVTVSVSHQYQRIITQSTAIVWVLVAISATIFIYIIPLMIAHQLTPYRSSLLISAIFLVVIIKFMLDQVDPARAFHVRALAIVGLIACVSGSFTGIVVFATAACLISAIQPAGQSRHMALVSTIFCFGLLYFTLAEFNVYDKYIFIRDKYVWALISFILVVVLIVSYSRYRLLNSIKPMSGVVAALIVLGILIPSRYVSPIGEGLADKYGDYLRASKIVEVNSNSADPILTAPLIDMPMLEITARRGSILQLVKAHVPYMAPSLVPIFFSVLRDFGIDIPAYQGTWVDLVNEAPANWKRLSTERIVELGVKYRTPVLITYSDHILDLPILYSGPHFSVYLLSARAL